MKRNIMAIAMLMAIFGCSNNHKSAQQETEKMSMSDLDTLTTPKIIKTADLSFRVKDARKTKTTISEKIKQYGGTLSEANLQTSVIQRERIKFSADSIMELTSYSTQALIIARIPSEKLDNFTDEIVGQADFLDQQSLKFDDQRINYMANVLKTQNRIDAAKQLDQQKTQDSRKTGEKNNIERSLAHLDKAVDLESQDMYIDEKVRFSTITLNFYQGNMVKKQLLVNDDLSDHKPGFINRIGLSFVNGWNILKELLIALVNLWTLILAGAAVYFIYSAYKTKTSKQA